MFQTDTLEALCMYKRLLPPNSAAEAFIIIPAGKPTDLAVIFLKRIIE